MPHYEPAVLYIFLGVKKPRRWKATQRHLKKKKKKKKKKKNKKNKMI
jgi:hypothetical protein